MKTTRPADLAHKAAIAAHLVAGLEAQIETLHTMRDEELIGRDAYYRELASLREQIEDLTA